MPYEAQLAKANQITSESTVNIDFIWVNFPRTGKMVKMWHFFVFFSSPVTKLFDFFNFFSTVLKRFCPLDSKNVVVLVPAHLEPELELFEVDVIGDDGDDDL